MKLLIQNGRVIDPASGFDQTGVVAIAAGRIVAIGQAPDGFTPNSVIDAKGCIVAPGLVDLAASLREGLEETLTVQALGVPGALYRTLRTTNPIENLNGSVARYCRNVKRWGDGQMVLRWVASALSDAAGRMRKLRGSSQMRSLLKALEARRPDADNSTIQEAA